MYSRADSFCVASTFGVACAGPGCVISRDRRRRRRKARVIEQARVISGSSGFGHNLYCIVSYTCVECHNQACVERVSKHSTQVSTEIRNSEITILAVSTFQVLTLVKLETQQGVKVVHTHEITFEQGCSSASTHKGPEVKHMNESISVIFHNRHVSTMHTRKHSKKEPKRHFRLRSQHEFKELMLTNFASLKPLTRIPLGYTSLKPAFQAGHKTTAVRQALLLQACCCAACDVYAQN